MNYKKSKSSALGVRKRIKTLRQTLHLSQKEFAAKINAAPSQLSEIESGKANPGYHFIMRMVPGVRVNANWLISGTGEMFLEDETGETPCEKKGAGNFENLDFGNHNEDILEMLDYCSKSPLVRICMLAHFSKFLLNNEAIIKRDIKKYEKEKKNKK